MDDDDAMAKDTLEKFYNAMEEFGDDVIYMNARLIPKDPYFVFRSEEHTS